MGPQTLFIIYFVTATLGALQIQELLNLETDIRAKIDSFARIDDTTETKPLLATMVRLVFHDCAASTVNLNDNTLPKGKCNGCIDITNPEHSGLEYGAIYPLEQVYLNKNSITTYDQGIYSGKSYLDSTVWSNPSSTDWSTKLSRADFWAISATLAIEYGIKMAYAESIDPSANLTTNGGILQAIQGWNLVHGIRYFEGRTDCNNSPFENNQQVIFSADPNWEFKDLKEFFKNQLGFTTDREVLAIMGAHTLGKGHNTISDRSQIDVNTNCCGGAGYHGKWKGRASHTFTFEYYHDIYFMRWKQVPANEAIDGSNIPSVNSNNLQFKFFPDSGEASNNHNGFMLNIDQTLIFQPGLNITNITIGKVGCDVWELGCADPVNDCDGSYYGITTPCTRYTFPPVENIDPYFESYHIFDSGFYRDFGISWDKMITINDRNNLKYYVERNRPLRTYVGLKNTKNGDYEITKEWWYADLNNLQIWTLNQGCQFIKINDTQINNNSLNKNPFNGEFNSNSAYIFVYVTRDIQFLNGYYDPNYAGSQTWDIYVWLGSNVDEFGNLANVWDQINDYAQQIMIYMEDILFDQVDIGYDEWFYNIYTENQGSESVKFKNLFDNSITFTYDNTELTPNCPGYLIPTVDDYIIYYPGGQIVEDPGGTPIPTTSSPSSNNPTTKKPTESPVSPGDPTKAPTDPTQMPKPTNDPTKIPISNPSVTPTMYPSEIPISNPSDTPTTPPIFTDNVYNHQYSVTFNVILLTFVLFFLIL